MPRRDLWPFIGLVAFFVILFVAVFGERIAPHESIYFVVQHGRDPRPYDPGLVFPFGSDILGRDLFSLVLAGARTTIVIVVLGGIARVLAGALLALAAALSRRARVAADALSEIVAAVPATLVVLLVVLVFVRGDTTFLVFVGALLISGWAGPYRVLRAELDRLGHMGFTESAAALGLSRPRIAVRHHLPHLVPLLALNLSQQSVASLVALAELGVLGVFVGTYRMISIAESLPFVPIGMPTSAYLADPPEWGGLLANARSTENLWTTRWVFLVPGVAFALLAIALAAVGLGLARRYARRDLVADLRGRGAAALAAAVAILFVAGALVPPRYADAAQYAAAARERVAAVDDPARAFADAGLVAVGGSFTLERDVDHLVRDGLASARVGEATITERADGRLDVLPLLYAGSGGGRVEAPVVFASWGLSPADHHPAPILGFPDVGTIIADWPDDYATVDVRGKIAVVLRAGAVATGSRSVSGPDPETSIDNALKRGPAAVIYVDPTLPGLPARYTTSGVVVSPQAGSGYDRIASLRPMTDSSRPPVLVVSVPVADELLRPAGIVPSEIYAALGPEGAVSTGSSYAKRSAARDLGVNGVVDVPVRRDRAHVRSALAAVPDAPAAPSILVWAVGGSRGSAAVDAMTALARSVADTRLPFVFVAFDPSVDPDGNAQQVADALAGRDISFIVVLDGLEGSALRFQSPNGDLIPAFDVYAERAGAAHVLTRGTSGSSGYEWPGIRPFIRDRSIVMSGTGGVGDLRAGAAATLGYLAGRLAFGAEELR